MHQPTTDSHANFSHTRAAAPTQHPIVPSPDSLSPNNAQRGISQLNTIPRYGGRGLLYDND